jgi:hypothetical protein
VQPPSAKSKRFLLGLGVRVGGTKGLVCCPSTINAATWVGGDFSNTKKTPALERTGVLFTVFRRCEAALIAKEARSRLWAD